MDSTYHGPWVEKYRPKSINEISSQEEVCDALKSCLSGKTLPHLLFYGPPGTGKTSTALALVKDLFGGNKDLIKKRVLELNASDERGINVVREKIKDFASVTVTTSPTSSIPPFKIVILDEADAMSIDAQSALRRTMEVYTKVTRFILICNYVSRIIDPLVSRCSKFRFKPLPIESMVGRLKHVCANENIKTDDESLKTLMDVSQGDMRRAITLLQSSAQFNNSVVDSETIVEVAGSLPPNAIKKLWTRIRGKLFDPIREEVDNVIAEGYAASMIISQLSEDLIHANDLTDDQKARMSLVLAEANMAIEAGADEELQLMSVASQLSLI